MANPIYNLNLFKNVFIKGVQMKFLLSVLVGLFSLSAVATINCGGNLNSDNCKCDGASSFQCPTAGAEAGSIYAGGWCAGLGDDKACTPQSFNPGSQVQRTKPSIGKRIGRK